MKSGSKSLLHEKAMLKLLLVRCAHQEQLLRFLPLEYEEEMQTFPEPRSLNCAHLLSMTHWIRPIHYSWFYEWLSPLPQPVQSLFLSLIPGAKREGVSKMLHLDSAQKDDSLSKFSRTFLLDYLKRRIQKQEILNEEMLPPSNLNILLDLSKKQLLDVIDLLGIHDLAADLRQVVDKELLGKIYRALSQGQLQFLHYCSKQPMRWLSPKLGLMTWDGKKESLNRQLHQRGLNRLARACFDENASFCWHLLHRLDTGRAKYIEKIFTQKQDLALIPYFKNQVLHILQRYNP